MFERRRRRQSSCLTQRAKSRHHCEEVSVLEIFSDRALTQFICAQDKRERRRREALR